MTVHLFGAVSSPAVANFGLNVIADRGESQYGAKAADFLRYSFYVDDGIISVDSVKEGRKLIEDTVAMCAKQGLRIHKFVSNVKEVLDRLPKDEVAVAVKNLQLDPNQRALGIEWNIGDDSLRFQSTMKEGALTRRGLMATVYSLYDPLGLLSPVTLMGRRILQDVCKAGIEWDDPLPKEIIERWEAWVKDLENLKTVKVPRCLKPDAFGDLKCAELHTFSDASNEGYGQCSYLRLIDQHDRVYCSLVMSKARVVPLKQMTIPRLELVAATLAVNVSSIVKRELQITGLKEYFYTNSKVVLGYITHDAKRLHTFVANRIQKIRNYSEPSQWTYVKSKENPADFASRGALVGRLMDSCWFTGPEFLWKEDLNMTTDPLPEILNSDPEVNRKVLVTNARPQDSLSERFSYFSDWRRLKRAIAHCQQYVRILKSKVVEKEIYKGLK
jgi:hypothetical protein